MDRARLRALTRSSPSTERYDPSGRNGESPTKGIDTRLLCRLLRHRLLNRRRNGESPTKGIDTLFVYNYIERSFDGRNGESPTKGIDTCVSIFITQSFCERLPMGL